MPQNASATARIYFQMLPCRLFGETSDLELDEVLDTLHSIIEVNGTFLSIYSSAYMHTKVLVKQLVISNVRTNDTSEIIIHIIPGLITICLAVWYF